MFRGKGDCGFASGLRGAGTFDLLASRHNEIAMCTT